jgi:hypothetical protein
MFEVTPVRRLSLSLLSASAAIAVLGITSAAAGAATASSSTCLPATTQAFAAAGDFHPYFLLSGGAFEAGTPTWNLAGGAARVAGNNTAGGDPLANTTSLSLPAGSSATSPTVCVTRDAPTIRFYVRNTGAASSRLGVTVFYSLPNGMPKSKQVASVSGTGVWQASAAIVYMADKFAAASATGTTNVSFQFTPLDANGQWRVDDVYVDPFKRG